MAGEEEKPYDPLDPSTYVFPTYEVYRFEDMANALHEVRRQHHAGKPTVWTGPDEIHYSITATVPPPSDHFTPEGAEYNRDHGRGFWDSFIQVSFMFGWHNGVVTHERREAKSKAADLRAIDAAIKALEKGDLKQVASYLDLLKKVR
jgi:hypothetical protein